MLGLNRCNMPNVRLFIGLALALLLSGQTPDESRRIVPVSATGTVRKALLIGNQKYPRLPLKNPVNDARDLGKALDQLGFKTTILSDSGKTQILAAVSAFAGDLAPGDIGIFFYSGHGFQINSENYLVPVDFSASTGTEARDQSVPFLEIKAALERTPAALALMILDSCRDNPFAGTGDANRGLALLEAGLGSYIAFAASPGKTASDNPRERNGLFTKHLLLELRQPVGLAELFRRVRKDVFEASGGRQLPYLHDQMIADFVMSPAVVSTLHQTPAVPPPATGDAGRIEEGKRLYQLGQCEDAVKVFDGLARRDPEDAFVQNALGLAYVCLKMNSPAAEKFTMAISLKPDFAAAYLNRGQVYLGAAKFELAIEDFSWAIEQEPGNGVSYWRRGWARFGLRRYEDARNDFDRAIELDPSDANAYHGRGKVWHQLGNYPQALADYNAALERRPNFAACYADRAVTRDRTGDKAGAAADEEAARRYRARI